VWAAKGFIGAGSGSLQQYLSYSCRIRFLINFNYIIFKLYFKDSIIKIINKYIYYNIIIIKIKIKIINF
jgi:hypothetical protein